MKDTGPLRGKIKDSGLTYDVHDETPLFPAVKLKCPLECTPRSNSNKTLLFPIRLDYRRPLESDVLARSPFLTVGEKSCLFHLSGVFYSSHKGRATTTLVSFSGA